MRRDRNDHGSAASPEDPAFARAVELHQRGALHEAGESYREILAFRPRHVGALHMYGVLLLQLGDVDRGIDLVRESLRMHPEQPVARLNLGSALLRSGRPADALVEIEQALRLDPRHPGARLKRGEALLALGRASEAEPEFRESIRLNGNLQPAHHGLGLALLAEGRHGDARETFERLVARWPDSVRGHVGLASVLLEMGEFEQALTAVDAALRLDAAALDALNLRGGVLLQLRRPVEAARSFGQALDRHGPAPEVLVNRAEAMLQLGDVEQAVRDCEIALRARPEFFDAHNTLGNAQREAHRWSKAIECFDRAIRLQPRSAEAWANRAAVHLALERPADAIADCDRALALNARLKSPRLHRANALLRLDRIEEAVADLQQLVAQDPTYGQALGTLHLARLQLCDWRSYAPDASRLHDMVVAGAAVSMPFPFLSVPATPEVQLACARAYVLARYPMPPPARPSPRMVDDGRIRVAYLSADFQEHATSYLMAGLFEKHDRERFAVIGVSFGPASEDAMRLRLRLAFEEFYEVGAMSDAEVAGLLRERGIHIAVDLKGHTFNSRLGILAHGAAPIHVTYLGYPGTTGADFVDYVLADSVVIPPEERTAYTEKVVCLRDSYQVNDDRRPMPGGRPDRPALGLPESAFVFCAFNNLYKITPPVFEVWMRLLRAVEGSVLWLIDGHAVAKRNLTMAAAAAGVAAERLVFAPKRPLAEHLARYPAADLFLDTLPINAHTTASDALWSGVPVLTCRGTAFAGRVAASLLMAVGLPRLVAEDLAQYEEIALRLAGEPKELETLRAHLVGSGRSSALFDTNRKRQQIELAYRTMFERWQRGEPPESFSV